VEETKLIASEVPLRLTFDADRKFVPVKVRVVSGTPAAMTDRDREIMRWFPLIDSASLAVPTSR